jgi:hypothetical protein
MSDALDSPENNPDGINPSLEEDSDIHLSLSDEMTPDDDLTGIIAALSREFDEVTQQRHKAGALKYGPGKFLTVDTLQEACDEVADLANYARYTYIKLRLLQESIMRQVESESDESPGGFVRSSDFTKPKGTME